LTERLYYNDARLAEFRATITELSDGGRRVYLDRTAFYPASGGQPHDLGTIGGVAVAEVIDEGEEIAHLLAEPVAASEVQCRLDWRRRFDHMQQHTGQHLLSAVFHEQFGFETLSFHMGDQVSTIELSTPTVTADQLAAAERLANDLVFENRPVSVTYEDEASGLRKQSQRTGTLRVVTIDSLDRSACGGTHVASTGEIGPILLRGTEKIRSNVRVEFVCGARAVRRARADYDALTGVARVFSAALDEAPALAAAQQAKLADSEKQRRKLSGELALRRGQELYASGERRHVRRVSAIDDDIRQEAQGFTAGAGATFIATCDEPPSILLVVSKDSAIHAGNELKSLLAEHGGRGGGSATQAQGSLPDRGSVEALLARLSAATDRSRSS
jgi:alanyl-tRNA synthetase